MVKGIIFDMDGTIIDSMPYWKKSGEEVINEMVRPRYPELFKDDIPLNNVIETMIEKIDDKEFLMDCLKTWYLVKMKNYYKQVKIKDGVIDFLNDCKKKNIKMCLATATPACLALDVVKRLNLEDYFIEVKTTDMGFRSKKHSDIYDYCLDSMGFNKQDVLVFEDTLNPLKTLSNASYRTVAVEDSVSLPIKEELKKYANYYIETYVGLDINKF